MARASVPNLAPFPRFPRFKLQILPYTSPLQKDHPGDRVQVLGKMWMTQMMNRLPWENRLVFQNNTRQHCQWIGLLPGLGIFWRFNSARTCLHRRIWETLGRKVDYRHLLIKVVNIAVFDIESFGLSSVFWLFVFAVF